MSGNGSATSCQRAVTRQTGALSLRAPGIVRGVDLDWTRARPIDALARLAVGHTPVGTGTAMEVMPARGPEPRGHRPHWAPGDQKADQEDAYARYEWRCDDGPQGTDGP